MREIGETFTGYRDGETGTVRVGASTSIGTYFFPAVIAGFAARHPRIEVTLEIENTTHIEQGLLRDQFDLCYLGGPIADPRLVADPLLEDEIVFACGPDHGLTAQPRVAFSDLPPHRRIVREPGSATRRTLEAYARDRGLMLLDPVQIGSVEAIKQAVRRPPAGCSRSWWRVRGVPAGGTAGRTTVGLRCSSAPPENIVECGCEG